MSAFVACVIGIAGLVRQPSWSSMRSGAPDTGPGPPIRKAAPPRLPTRASRPPAAPGSEIETVWCAAGAPARAAMLTHRTGGVAASAPLVRHRPLHDHVARSQRLPLRRDHPTSAPVVNRPCPLPPIDLSPAPGEKWLPSHPYFRPNTVEREAEHGGAQSGQVQGGGLGPPRRGPPCRVLSPPSRARELSAVAGEQARPHHAAPSQKANQACAVSSRCPWPRPP